MVQPWPCYFFQVYCFAHVLIATCQYGCGGIVQSRDGEALIQPYYITAAPPDSPPDLREEPVLEFKS